MMQIPEIEDFMECFGMEPIEKDVDMISFRYIKKSDAGLWELEFSFCATTYSFLVISRCDAKEMIRIYSEKTKKLRSGKINSAPVSTLILRFQDAWLKQISY